MKELTPHDGASSPFDAIRRVTDEGREYWSARDLMPLLGYDRWENFAKAISRAEIAVDAQNGDHDHHFRDATKVVERSQGGGSKLADVELTRFAAYQVAMCGDPRKPEVAAALAYFAIRTREAETAQPKLTDADLMALALQASQRQLDQRDARIAAQAKQLTEQAPKVTYVDTFVTDADLLSFSTVASSCNITEKALRELLIERDWIYSQQDSRWSEGKQKKVTRNRYSEKADKKRYFRRVEVHEAPRFRGSEVMHTLKITPAGAEAIARLVGRAA